MLESILGSAHRAYKNARQHAVEYTLVASMSFAGLAGEGCKRNSSERSGLFVQTDPLVQTDPITIQAPDLVEADEDGNFSLKISAQDNTKPYQNSGSSYSAKAGDPLEYRLAVASSTSEENPWVRIDQDGTINGIPRNSNVGDTDYELEVKNGNGDSAKKKIKFRVKNVNNPPAITSKPIEACGIARNYEYSLEAQDDDPSETLSYELTSNTDSSATAGGLSIDSSTGKLAWPATLQGDYTVEARVKDSKDVSDDQQFTLHISNNLVGLTGQVKDEEGNALNGLRADILGISSPGAFGDMTHNDGAKDGVYSLGFFATGIHKITITGSNIPNLEEIVSFYAPIDRGWLNRDFIISTKNPITSTDPYFTDGGGNQSFLKLFKLLTDTEGAGKSLSSLTKRWPGADMPVKVYLNETAALAEKKNSDGSLYDSIGFSGGLIVPGANGIHDYLDHARFGIGSINDVLSGVVGGNLFDESLTAIDSTTGVGTNMDWRLSVAGGGKGATIINRENTKGLQHVGVEISTDNSDSEIGNRVLHELLHSAGMVGHSPDSIHIMHEDATSPFSDDEKRVLKMLYRLPEKEKMNNHKD